MAPNLKRERTRGRRLVVGRGPGRGLVRSEDALGLPARAVGTGVLRSFLIAILVVAAAGGAASAQASDVAVHVPDRGVTNGTSTNWSGYFATSGLGNGAHRVVSDVAGQWVVPDFTCPATGFTYSSFWVGIDGARNHTVEQTGTEEDCNYGAMVSYAWYEMYPALPVRLAVPAFPGDPMSAEVTYAGADRFVLTISNLRTGQTFSVTQVANAKRQSAEWIAEAPSSGNMVLPLTNFGTVSFTAASATFSGVTGPISDPAWQYEPVTMAYPTGTVKAVPSALDPSGQSFSVTWQHS